MAVAPLKQAMALIKQTGVDAQSNLLIKKALFFGATAPLVNLLKTIVDLSVTTATSQRNVNVFRQQLGRLSVVVFLNLVWKVIADSYQKRLELLWRTALTQQLHEKYLTGIRFYEAMYHRRTELRIPDCDVRIVEDLPLITQTLSCLIAGSYKQNTTGIATAGLTGVAGLVGIFYNGSWPVLFTAVTMIFGGVILPGVIAPVNQVEVQRPVLTAWSKVQQQLVRVQAYDEQVCALRGSAVERKLADGGLEETITKTAASNRQSLFNQAIQYLMMGIGLPGVNQRAPNATLAGCLFMAAPYYSEMIRHKPRGGSLPPVRPLDAASTEMAARFTAALWDVTMGAYVIVGLFGVSTHMLALGSVAAQIDRVKELFDSLDALEAESEVMRVKSFRDSEDAISFDGVDISTPTGTQLVRHLSFSVSTGESLLVTGHNGAGKSSIFRVLGGLWPALSGTVARPRAVGGLAGAVYYLPQKPYSVLGTLFDLFFYPQPPPKEATKADIRRWLSYVDLADLADRPGAFSGEHDWEEELSLGELQRIGMVRLFYHQPRFVILDECSSATSFDIEKRLFDLCHRLGISHITIAHRPLMEAFHTRSLALTGKPELEGGWKLRELQHVKAIDHAVLSLEARHTIIQDYLRESGARCTPNGEVLTPEKAELPDNVQANVAGLQAAGMMERCMRIWAVLKLGMAGAPRAKQHSRWLFLLCVVRTFLNIHNFTSGMTDMIGATLTFNSRWFFSSLLHSVACGALLTLLDSGIVVATQALQLDCWRGLGKHLHEKFFLNDAFYHVRNQRPVLVAQPARQLLDAKTMVENAFKQVEDALKPLMTISVGAVLIVNNVGAVGGLALVGTFVFGRVATRMLMPNFGAQVKKQVELEGRFKTVHARLKEHSEAVAFSGGIGVERKIIEGRFGMLTKHQEGIMNEEGIYMFVKTGLQDSDAFPLMMLKLLGMSFVTSRFGGMIEGGATSAAALMANFNLDRIIMNVTFPFLSIVGEIPENVARLEGEAARILEFSEHLGKVASSQACEEGSNDPSPASVEFRNLSIVTPDGRMLVGDLNGKITQGEPVIVTGQNASGKSSLSRVLTGLWEAGSGEALVCGQLVSPHARPASSDLFVVPQKPYLCHGLSLAAQLSYPSDVEVDDKTLRETLDAVGIAYLLERFDARGDLLPWQDTLSGGEQQRLALARCFFHRPRFAVLDDCTSMVSQEAEVKLYEAVLKAGITPIAMSQRLLLPELFPQELALGVDPAGGWKLQVRS